MCAPRLARGAALIAAALLIGAALPPAARGGQAGDGPVEITAALINAGMGRSDAAHEWVLLTNLSAEPAALRGWTLADNSSSDPLADRILPPGASLLVAAACSALIEAPAADADDVLSDSAIGGGLANRGDLLELRDGNGSLIDAVSWGSARGGGPPPPAAGAPLHFGAAPIPLPRPAARPARLKIEAGSGGVVKIVNACEWDQALDGWSLEHGAARLNLAGRSAPANGALQVAIDAAAADLAIELRSPDGQLAAAASWPSSPPAGGAADSAPTADAEPAPTADAESAAAANAASIRVAEFMPRPLPGQPEWVELINDGLEAVDLAGWRIGDERSSRELWGLLEPGQRVVFAPAPLLGAETDIRILDGAIGNGLNNDGDTLQLIAPDGAIVATIEYGVPAFPAPAAGVSLALTPRVWVANQTPSPGGPAVSPALETLDVVVEPVERAAPQPIQIHELQSESGINPWMVVSAGLGGLLLALLLRRWAPGQREAAEAPPLPEPPPPEPALLDYSAIAADAPPPEASAAREQPAHPWDGEQR